MPRKSGARAFRNGKASTVALFRPAPLQMRGRSEGVHARNAYVRPERRAIWGAAATNQKIAAAAEGRPEGGARREAGGFSEKRPCR